MKTLSASGHTLYLEHSADTAPLASCFSVSYSAIDRKVNYPVTMLLWPNILEPLMHVMLSMFLVVYKH